MRHSNGPLCLQGSKAVKPGSRGKSMKTKARIASRWLRFRAFLIDIFLIYVPILYAFYFVLGSKEAFLTSVLIPLFCTLFFGFVQTIFLSLKAQSPDLKPMNYI